MRTLSLDLRADPGRQRDALDLVVRAAESGDAMSLRGMGRRYALGVEVEEDERRALANVAALTEGRMGRAAHLLARVVDDGPDHPRAAEVAFRLYWRALAWLPAEAPDASDQERIAAAQERVRALARLLPPETVAAAWRKALAPP